MGYGAIKRQAQTLPSAVNTNPTSSTLFTSSGSTVIAIQFPDAGQLEKKPFRIAAWGRVTPGTSGNLSINFYIGTAKTTSDTNIMTSGALAASTTAGNWYFEYDGLCDTTNQSLRGIFRGWVNGTAKADTIYTTVFTLDTSGAVGTNFITVGALFGTSNAGNLAYLDGFELQER